MRIQTMNRKINEAQHEMSYVLGEYKLKLDKYLREIDTFTYSSDVDCHNVKMRFDNIQGEEVIKEIEDNFLLELYSYNETHAPNGRLVDVEYIFTHKKPS